MMAGETVLSMHVANSQKGLGKLLDALASLKISEEETEEALIGE